MVAAATKAIASTDFGHTRQQALLCARLKRLGFARGQQVMLYGHKFELLTDPFAIVENLIVVDAIEIKSCSRRRVRVPLPIMKMASVS